ncbi:hypothetical protein DD788_29035, partial [Ralstonia pickettii]|nr:hypothetical protein [Ralstonia pickettii]
RGRHGAHRPATEDAARTAPIDAVRVRQGERAVQLPAVRDANLAETVVRVSAATPAGAALGSLSGELVVEKA